jgi:hypothetical protein
MSESIVVASVINNNQARYGKANISFRCIDAACEDLPEADLLTAKEVLQHLYRRRTSYSRESQILPVRPICQRHLPRKAQYMENLWRWKSVCSKHSDVSAGGYRPLALREPPFSITSTVMLTYTNQYNGLRWTKEVLLWCRHIRTAKVQDSSV